MHAKPHGHAGSWRLIAYPSARAREFAVRAALGAFAYAAGSASAHGKRIAHPAIEINRLQEHVMFFRTMGG